MIKTKVDWKMVFCAAALAAGMACAVPLRMEVVEMPKDVAAKAPHLNPQYLVFTPKQKDGSEKLPLLIYLHGGGGGGTDVLKHRHVGPVRFWNGSEKVSPFKIVVPQVLSAPGVPRKQWQARELDVLLGHLSATLEFDGRRVYLTGTSMGGYGTWHWAAHSPQHFAAIAPLCGGLGDGPKGIVPDLEEWLDNLAGVPAWIFHGAKDKTVPPDRSERMFQGLKKRGAENAKLLIYPDLGHGIGKTYRNPELYDWFLQHVRPE